MENFYLIKNDSGISLALWTAVFTLVGGVILFVCQKVFSDFILEPVNKYRDIVSKISVDLIKYAKFYANPYQGNDITKIDNGRNEILIRDYENASNTTRELSALLKVSVENIICYELLLKMKILKNPKNNVVEASILLMSLSNSYSRCNDGIKNSETANKIRKLLNIPIS